jgi:hypothetical protein
VNTIGSPTYRFAKHMAGLFTTHNGNSPHYVRNSVEFVQTLGSFQDDPHDIMVSFDVVSLFTRVLIKDTMDLLGHHFEDNLRLFRQSLPPHTSASMASYTNKSMVWIWAHHCLQSLPTSTWSTSRRGHLTWSPKSPSAGFAMWMTPSSSGHTDLRSVK